MHFTTWESWNQQFRIWQWNRSGEGYHPFCLLEKYEYEFLPRLKWRRLKETSKKRGVKKRCWPVTAEMSRSLHHTVDWLCFNGRCLSGRPVRDHDPSLLGHQPKSSVIASCYCPGTSVFSGNSTQPLKNGQTPPVIPQLRQLLTRSGPRQELLIFISLLAPWLQMVKQHAIWNALRRISTCEVSHVP